MLFCRYHVMDRPWVKGVMNSSNTIEPACLLCSYPTYMGSDHSGMNKAQKTFGLAPNLRSPSLLQSSESSIMNSLRVPLCHFTVRHTSAAFICSDLIDHPNALVLAPNVRIVHTWFESINGISTHPPTWSAELTSGEALMNGNWKKL